MNFPRLGSRDFLKAVRPFAGLFVVLLLFALDGELRSLFFKGSNFKMILTQTVIVAIGAMGMTMVIVSGGIDLSAGSVVALCSVVTARLIEQGHGLAAVLTLTVLAGGLAFLPIFIANLIFADRFSDEREPTVAFGANVLGAVLGGVLEYVALLTGYRGLLFMVAAAYAMALVSTRLSAARPCSVGLAPSALLSRPSSTGPAS